jgi:lysine-specific demethylase/histidyl-hydroxylase NO66
MDTMVQREISTFESLIFPVTKREFIDAHWGKSTLILHRRDRGYFRDLFSLSDMDACLMTAANRSSKILHIIPTQGSRRGPTLTPVAALSKDLLYEAYLSGDSIRLIGIEKIWPPLGLLAASLQEVFDMEIGVNLFLTPPGSQAFPTHVDTLDSLIVQVAGSKQWYIWEQIYERPLESQRSHEHVAKITWTEEKLTLREKPFLEAGDIIYLPRGFFHKAIAGDEFSLHLTISFHPLSWVDFFSRALELAALEDLELRQDLPPGFIGDREMQQSMPSTFARLLGRLNEKLSFDATLRSLVEEHVSSRAFPPDGHFAVLASLQEIGPDSAIERRRGLVCLVESSGGTVAIRFGPRRVQGPMEISSTLEFIRDHTHFRVCDLPNSISLDSKLALVRRLIHDGLLRPS